MADLLPPGARFTIGPGVKTEIFPAGHQVNVDASLMEQPGQI
jgi:hypothetical protein